MAAVWGVEGAAEGSVTGVAAASEEIEWRDAEVFEDVCGGHWAAVSHAVAAERIKVQLTPSPPTGFKFQKLFGDAQLREAGFGRMPFAKCVRTICGALKADESMNATVTENDSGGIDLDIYVTVGYFEAEYKLSLDKVAIGASDKLSAELIVTKQQLATARIELEQMTTALRDSITEADTTKQQLATATKRIADLCSQLEKEKTESESRISEMKQAMAKLTSESRCSIEQMRAANEELRAEIHTRDKHIAVLQSASKPTGRSITITKDTLYRTKGVVTEFYFDSSSSKGAAQYKVSIDSKTAEKSSDDEMHTVLRPEFSSSGIHKVRFRVVRRTGLILVGVTQQIDRVWSGCCFYDVGSVFKKTRKVAESLSFGRRAGIGWQNGDVITLTVDLGNCKVSIRTPYGVHSTDWKPPTTGVPLWFAFKAYKAGTTMSIV